MDVLRWVFWVCFRVVQGFWRTARWLRPYIFPGRTRGPRSGGTHGTARWATRWELLRSGALTGQGPVVGRGPFGRLIRFTKDGLMMVFAATGAGKGLGIVIPTLLDYPGSVVVTDPKGENYAITQRRRAQLGPVLMLNPGNLAESAKFNPLDTIRAGTVREADDAAALARLMVNPAEDNDPAAHWDRKAASLLTGLILHTLHEPPETRTLAHVRILSVGGIETLRETLTNIATGSPSRMAAEIAAGFLPSLPGGTRDKASDEFTSVLSNLHKATEPWSGGTPAGMLSQSSTFAMEDLADRVCSLFLCVDEDVLSVYGAWLRVVTGCALNAMIRAKDRPSPRHKVVFLLDEVAALGPLEPLERNAGLLRAYCTPVLIWQNMPQAEAVYGPRRAEAFLANCSCRMFFGVADNNTGHYVATMLGNTTVLSASQGVSQSSEAWLRENRSENRSESGYWLLDPAEVQRLGTTKVVCRFRDLPFPVIGTRLDYRKVLRWRGLWDAWRATAPGGPAGPLRGLPTPAAPSGQGPAPMPRPAAAARAAFPAPAAPQGTHAPAS
jgi:type IV secretion system protein VirD4